MDSRRYVQCVDSVTGTDYLLRIENCFRDIRAKYGLTQSELAIRLGVSKNAISAYENGDYLPSITVLAKCRILFPDDDVFRVTVVL